jgi:hypothetical protein
MLLETAENFLATRCRNSRRSRLYDANIKGLDCSSYSRAERPSTSSALKPR